MTTFRVARRPSREQRHAARALALACALAGGAARAQAGADPARQLFERGSAALDAQRWPDAIDALEQARAIQPLPAVLFNLGLAYRGAGQRARAVALFEDYLARSSATASRRAEAVRNVAELRALLAELRLRVTPADAAVTVDGRPPATPGAPLLLEPGSHTVAVAAAGFVPREEPVVAAAGTSRELVIALRTTPVARAAAPPDERPVVVQRPGAALGLIAAGAASLVASGVLYGVTYWAVGSCATEGDSLVCPTQPAVDQARGAFGYNVAAHVTLGAGLALTGTGVLWYLLGGRAATTPAPTVGVALAPGGGLVTVGGRF